MPDVNPILAADLIEILARGIPVILFVLWLVGQALSERHKQAKAAPRQARPAPPQPKRAANEIEDEIDAFLRRAAEKKGQPQREETLILVPPKPEAPQPKPPLRPKPAALGREAASPRGPRSISRPLRQPPAQARPVRTEKSPPPATIQGGKLAPPLRTGLASMGAPLTPSILQGASHLGEEVAFADERMEAHLQSVFDHQLGSLRHREIAPARRVGGSPATEAIVKMLQDPQGVQQMIIISEVLRRPDI